ncbi:Nrap protein [Lineolata rhizophorae]|uniref:U3 small nucleolar RNA-associated protein 22 n=1 Tax=Lineolata rhizophorae TaxID=578093 RepID=A0A6A6P6G5_9PEZI|nr:Nrap protein [Lineolata rhizophorae]
MKRKRGLELEGAYTGEIYKSNVFKLLVDDLLEQARPRYGKKEAPAETALRTLKAIIEGIPEKESVSMPQVEKEMKPSKIRVPFPDPPPPKDAKYTMQYAKPASVNVVGSYPLKLATRIGDKLVIDLIVTMPSAMFSGKDFLNYRYFYKRAYYLACLAAGIKDAKDHKFKLNFETLHGNPLQPILMVEGSEDGGKDDFSSSKCQIHIIPTIPRNLFPEDKLHPDKNCVRPKAEDGSNDTPKLTPTPFYNASVRMDAQTTEYVKLLHSTANRCDAFRDACLLGRIWLRQRGLGGNMDKGGFGNFEWAAVMALLLQGGSAKGAPALSTGYSSYQLFKGMLQFLASRDLAKNPWGLQVPDGLQLRKGDGSPMIYDGARGVDLLFKMTPWSYRALQAEARISVDTLGDSSSDQFEPTFIYRVDDPALKFDLIAKVPVSSLDVDMKTSNFDQKVLGKLQKLYSTLVRGLTDRVSRIDIYTPEGEPWQLGSTKPARYRDKEIMVSFVLNAANASRAVDHGPPAETQKEAAAFRHFWGDKAELRRFKDGSIQESLVWSTKNTKQSIVEQMVTHLLRRHVSSAAADGIRFISSTFEQAMGQSGHQGERAASIAPFAPIMAAFRDLEKDIRGLDGLPLTVRHVFAASDQLRYTAIEAPVLGPASGRPASPSLPPADVVIQFEGSGRWPDDLAAIQRTKLAFLLRLAELLEDSVAGVTARVGLENSAGAGAEAGWRNQGFLDVAYAGSGARFRLRVHSEREATLLERRLRDRPGLGPAGAAAREAAARALRAHRRAFVAGPAHTQAFQTLCTRFAALSPAARLLRRWFAAHLLGAAVPAPVVEALALRPFVAPAPWAPPASAPVAFYRALFFLARWDWRAEPLALAFGGDSAGGGGGGGGGEAAAFDPAAATARFAAWRALDPALNRVALFAASPADPSGTAWTERARPPRVAATRMTGLARAAWGEISGGGGAGTGTGGKTETVEARLREPGRLFVSDEREFDFVLRLRAGRGGGGDDDEDDGEAVGGTAGRFKNLALGARARATGVAGGRSAGGLAEARESFAREAARVVGDAAALFWDGVGGRERGVVGGVWNPEAARGRRLRRGAGVGWSSVPVGGADGDGLVRVNREGVLSEIARLGGDLVERVEVYGGG